MLLLPQITHGTRDPVGRRLVPYPSTAQRLPGSTQPCPPLPHLCRSVLLGPRRSGQRKRTRANGISAITASRTSALPVDCESRQPQGKRGECNVHVNLLRVEATLRARPPPPSAPCSACRLSEASEGSATLRSVRQQPGKACFARGLRYACAQLGLLPSHVRVDGMHITSYARSAHRTAQRRPCTR